MLKELDKKYDHLKVEKDKMNNWEAKGYFASPQVREKMFSIVLPPPNITGKLHLGHAWDGTLQDMIARFKRLQGFNVKWQAGMDHAGISMQRKVEERMRANGYDTNKLKKEDFLVEAEKWKVEHQDIIAEQWKKMGFSLTYDDIRYTKDEDHNEVVDNKFIEMFNQGLIYRAKRAVNWDNIQKTAISNMEVINKDQEQNMYYIKYMINDTKFLEVATTRTETLFSDVAVVVNPKDKRYKSLIGKTCIHPLTGAKLPIISDEYVSLEKGTGAMKCSAHATEDISILEKNKLPVIESIDLDGNLTAITGKYEGIDRLAAREQIAFELKDKGLITKVEKTDSKPGFSERSGALVEVMYMEQWFVDMKKILENIEKNFGSVGNAVKFVPNRFKKTFENWMNPETLMDWCISRQLMWGHQIPVWYKDNQVKASITSPGEGWRQDPDVLDTWFSSGLWPMSVLTEEGYSDSKALSDVLVTGYDIIFFWVARMIFQTESLLNKEPFKDVLIHGLVRASDGRKMSKSLGNGVEPMEEVEKYGADALRWFLTTNSTPGQDLRYDVDKVKSSWNFINKLWNTARFTMMNLTDTQQLIMLPDSEIDTWIKGRLAKTKATVQKYMDSYEFGIVGSEIYKFVYDDFASNYIELAKVNLADDTTKQSTQNTLRFVLEEILVMLHPFMPFVTEEIYTSLGNKSIMEYIPREVEATEMKQVDELINVISSLRQFRAENDIFMKTQINFQSEEVASLTRYTAKLVNAHISETMSSDITTLTAGKLTIKVDMNGLIDKEAAKSQLEADAKKLMGEIKRAEGMLSNPNFTNKAPEAKVKAETEKLENYKKQYEQVLAQLNKL